VEKDREKTRMCLKLLYERGETLEKVVREILRGLGADVINGGGKVRRYGGWLKSVAP
jgi:hypothetical protein